MGPSAGLKISSIILSLVLGLQSIYVPVALARPLPAGTVRASETFPSSPSNLVTSSGGDLIASLALEGWAVPSALGCRQPGVAVRQPAGESPCVASELAGPEISYPERKLILSHTLGSAGPPLTLRYESLAQPVPMVLSPRLSTLTPLRRWKISIAGWTFEGEGSQPLALWDTTDKATGEPVPAGVYDLEIRYVTETGTRSARESVIVRRTEAGALGANWSHNYEVSLRVIDEGRILLTGFGQAQLFTGQQGKYSSTTERGHTLTRLADGTWRWMRNGADGAPIQGVWRLDADGRATRWDEPSGRYVAVTYDDAGQLVSITDQSGHSTLLAYEGAHLASVTDAAGSIWQLGHEGDDLVRIVDPLEAGWSLQYSDAHQVTARTDPAGYTTRYTYAEDGLLAEIVDAAGHAVTLETVPDSVHPVASDVSASGRMLGTTLVRSVSADGRVTSEQRFAYDVDRRVVRVVRSPDGGETLYVWERSLGQGDEAGLLLSETDANGLTTAYTYRPGTALVEKVTAPPLPDVVYGYRQIAGYWVMTSLKVGDLATRYWRYDARGRCTGVEQGGLRWFYTYDDTSTAYGQPSAMVWNWNGQGDPSRTSSARIVRYTYDDLGKRVGVEDPLGGETRYGYDGAGRLVSITDALGRTRTVAYDAAGRIVRQADPLGGQTVYTFDAASRVTAVTDAGGSTTTYAYDYAGRVTEITDPLGRTAVWAYGSEGELLSHTDARGDKVTITNDGLGRPLALAYPNGQQWRVTYDAAGHVTSLSGDGLMRTVLRDVAGRVLQVADVGAGRSSWVGYSYNASGQVAEMRSSDGSVTTYAHGSLGEVKRISGPLGATEYTYETSGQLAPRRAGVRSGPLRTALTYDASGRLASIRHYQQESRVGVDRTMRYSYDAVGNVVSIETPEGIRAYAYDELDRLVAYTGTDGIKTTYAYDAVGYRTSLAVEGGEAIAYLYDAAHQLLQAGDTRYTYDPNGRLVSAADADGLRTFAWDYFGRLIQVAERASDALPYPLGPVATAEAVVVAYRYGPTGERMQTVRGEGAPQTTRYDGHTVTTLDGAGRVTEAWQQGAGQDEWTMVALSQGNLDEEPLVRYLLADAQGSVVGVVDESGALVYQVSFDPWGMPLAGVNGGPIEAEEERRMSLGFGGHVFEDGTGLYALDGRWYNPATGHFISLRSDPGAFGPAALNGYLFQGNNPLRIAPSHVDDLGPVSNTASPLPGPSPRDSLHCRTGGAFSLPMVAGGCRGIAFPLEPSMELADLSWWR